MADLSIQAILTAQTSPFQKAMKEASNSVRQFSADTQKYKFVSIGEALDEESKKIAASRAHFLKAGKKAFGALGLAATFGAEAMGDTRAGQVFGAAGHIAGSAALGGMAGGPVGAAIGGAVAALGEFREYLNRAEKAAQSLADAMFSGSKWASDFTTKMLAAGREPVQNFQRELLGRELLPGQTKQAGLLAGIFNPAGRSGRAESFRLAIGAAEAERKKIQSELDPTAVASFRAQLRAKMTPTQLAKGQEWGPEQINSVNQAVERATQAREKRIRRRLAANQTDISEFIVGRGLEQKANLLGDTIGGFASSIFSAPSRVNSSLIPNQWQQPINAFVMAGKDAFSTLSGAVAKWKAEVDAAAESAKRASKGAIGEFTDGLKTLNAAGLSDQQFGFGALQLKAQLEQAVGANIQASNPFAQRGTQEFFRATHDQPQAGQTLPDLIKIAQLQLEEQKKLASDLAAEIVKSRIVVRMP